MPSFQQIDALSGLGFATMDCAQHCVEQQARAFNAADIVVGTHGAGLANIVYVKRGTTVIEIMPEGYDQGVTSYRSLADHFRYAMCRCLHRKSRLTKAETGATVTSKSMSGNSSAPCSA